MIRIWGAAKCSNRMVPSERPGAPRRRPGTPRHPQRDTQENAKGHPETHKAAQGATGNPQETLRDPQWSPGGAQESTRETRDIPKRRPETPNDTQKSRHGRLKAPKACQRGAPETPVTTERQNAKTFNAVTRQQQKRRRVKHKKKGGVQGWTSVGHFERRKTITAKAPQNEAQKEGGVGSMVGPVSVTLNAVKR